MPLPPAIPSLTVTRVSPTAFSASIGGGTAGANYRLYWRLVGQASDTLHTTTVTGSGTFGNVDTQSVNATVQAYVVGSSDWSTEGASLPVFGYVNLSAVEDLAGALHSYLAADPVLAAQLVGGFWTGEVPEGTAMPYAWIEFPETLAIPNFVDQMESSKINVHIWTPGANAALKLARLLKARVDYTSLPSFGDTQVVGMMPRAHRIQCEYIRDAQSRLIYRSIVTFQVVTQLPR